MSPHKHCGTVTYMEERILLASDLQEYEGRCILQTGYSTPLTINSFARHIPFCLEQAAFFPRMNHSQENTTNQSRIKDGRSGGFYQLTLLAL